MFFGVAISEIPGHAQFTTAPAIQQRLPVAEGRPFPSFGSIGTGGVPTISYMANRQGYRLVTIAETKSAVSEVPYEPYVGLVQEVQMGFGRTFSHLPAVFGVSRQALYNWKNGEIPKEQHRAKLIQLAEAAKVFTAAGFKPSAEMIERTVAKGKSFVDLMSDGANGREMAEKLIRIVKRGLAERESLDTLLGDRKTPSRLSVSDLGRQSFPDEA